MSVPRRKETSTSSTLSPDESLQKMATEMQDTDMVAKIAERDLIAFGAKYHLQCLIKYKNMYRSIQKSGSKEITHVEKCTEALAFAELVAFVWRKNIHHQIVRTPLFLSE